MSSFAKTKLKAARDALGKKQHEAARDAASQVLDYEPENYNACVKSRSSQSESAFLHLLTDDSHVFLGLAFLELGQHDKSEQVKLLYIFRAWMR
jgi:superkiller protein 3